MLLMEKSAFVCSNSLTWTLVWLAPGGTRNSEFVCFYVLLDISMRCIGRRFTSILESCPLCIFILLTSLECANTLIALNYTWDPSTGLVAT